MVLLPKLKVRLRFVVDPVPLRPPPPPVLTTNTLFSDLPQLWHDHRAAANAVVRAVPGHATDKTHTFR